MHGRLFLYFLVSIRLHLPFNIVRKGDGLQVEGNFSLQIMLIFLQRLHLLQRHFGTGRLSAGLLDRQEHLLAGGTKRALV